MRIRLCNGFPVLLLLLIGLVAAVACAPLVKRDADFESVPTRMKKDSSGKGGDPKEKYWHESVFHPHYDGRFTDRPLNYEDQISNLTQIMQAYLSTMQDLGIETWIIHGTLLGWWWNRKIMPWDSDIDVQISAESVHFLANYYNMTIYSYKKRDYMLEINPKYIDGSFGDYLNVIDARWIDTVTGVFIDITAARPYEGHEGILASKDMHKVKETDLYPLRDSIFEGQHVKIPYNYAVILEGEYGKKSLTKTAYQGHKFNSTSMRWEKNTEVPYDKHLG